MAELVDAGDLKSPEPLLVGVRSPFRVLAKSESQIPDADARISVSGICNFIAEKGARLGRNVDSTLDFRVQVSDQMLIVRVSFLETPQRATVSMILIKGSKNAFEEFCESVEKFLHNGVQEGVNSQWRVLAAH